MKHADDAIEKVLAGLRSCEPSPGMERRVLEAVRQAENQASAGSAWHRRRPAWLIPQRHPAAFAVALAALVAGALAIPSFHSLPRLGPSATQSRIDAHPAPSTAIARIAPLARPERRARTIANPRPARPIRNPLAVREMLAASRPAPPIPLTQQEKLLLRVARSTDPAQLAMLNPEARATQEAESNAEFRRFWTDNNRRKRMNRYSCGSGIERNTRPAIWMAGITLALAWGLPGAWAQAAPSGTNTVADAPSKSYRITYTITEVDGGKPVGTQHLSILVFSGRTSMLKEGSKVPVSTGTYNAGSPTQNNQVQYLDVGLNMEASLIERADRLILSTKLEQSSVAEEKSPMNTQDPVIRQTVFEDTSLLTPGKPLLLGSVDVPGTTRRLDVEVVPELVR